MKIILVLLAFVALSGCGDDTPDGGGIGNDQRKAMLQSLAENVIDPGFAEVATNAQALEDAINALSTAPGKQTLEAAQSAWKTLGSSWKRVEFFQQGLLDQERTDSLIYKIDLGAGDLSKRAALVDVIALDAAIASGKTLDVTFVQGLPATLQGMPALEEVLFDNSPETALAKFTTDLHAADRIAIAKALATSLRARLQMVHQSWDPNGGNFQQQFVNAFGTDLGSSLGMLINDVVTLAESMKNEKVARPLGLFNNNTPRPDTVEALRSSQSTKFIFQNITGIERMFTADADGRTGIGIDSLLNELDAKVGEINLSSAVLAQLSKMRETVTDIFVPLPEAIRANDPKVAELHEECRVLLKLLKVDVVSQLGVMITTLEGDGD